ncbi:hypothetical protein [Proteus mirabilis]|nr:hypothetical protein [Proteus mirabilis]
MGASLAPPAVAGEGVGSGGWVGGGCGSDEGVTEGVVFTEC